ncbi:hypothetical protein FXB39_10145 [Nocardioides sp. BGMRC 2183]|nr:hypothetical protein FXB39_10145 [Nocardioides sp. BGMRC 2183]
MRETRPMQPAALVFADTVHWWRMRSAVLRHLTNPAPGRPATHLRARSGDIIRLTRLTSAVTYGPHDAEEGRELRSRSEGRRGAVDHDHETLLRRTLSDTERRPAQPLLGSAALTFSDISDPTLRELTELEDVQDHLIAQGRFDPTDPVLLNLLWSNMIPTAILSRGRLIDRLEDAPELEPAAETLVITSPSGLELGEAIFHEADDDAVYTDNRALGWEIPPPLAPVPPPPEHDTPIGLVLARMEDRTGPRISGQDEPEADANVSRSLSFHQFPDPNTVEQKVRAFLLNPRHPKQRWVDFAQHGLLDRGTAALVLAANLSSIFYSPFPATEIRPTADGALQFTVPIALPTPRGYLLLTTSWAYRNASDPLSSADLSDMDLPASEATGLWLATAYPNSDEMSYGHPLRTFYTPDVDDWAALAASVEASGRAAATRMRANAVSSTGWLGIPRGTGRQEDFFKWVRRTRSPYTFTRKALGGQFLAYDPLRIPITGESEVSAALRIGQVILGMAGIRSYVQLHFD